MRTAQQPQHTSVLASLRAVIPRRADITVEETLRIAELQANKLLEQHGITRGATPTEIITELPKIAIAYTSTLVAGASYWDSVRHIWVIQLCRSDSWRRRRFTLAHEYKHIIDHGRSTDLYRGTEKVSAATHAERAADYFAGCLLIPRRLLKRAWGEGIQHTDALAHLFQVSEQAIGVRLRQIGLIDDVTRHVRMEYPGPNHEQTAFAPLTVEEFAQ
ncbi:ImmA/IrrE family metallo-endopeptidase [Rhodococcus sp. C3V]|uniref:ImmA/IrrE family metallo-endopeptidase n=1 Tax=Rhodococcus sp. C3V TaxID=3034165 RepID=UPI0023E2C19D|nr:ImmA/IrrE family metallo-endopeptidase [Rhodococcus sp. C3V]MDF3316422.1 ImmA/IrrE family metallo-endopeptidase [Rhodococcus sp. C3V]